MSLECRAARKSDLLKILGFPKDALELNFIMSEAWFGLKLDNLEAPVATREAPAVILVDGNIAGFANLYGCAFANCDAERVELACFNTNRAGLPLYPKLCCCPYDIESREGPTGKLLALLQFHFNRNNEV
tara:strand:+ start:423 stop:812 length:390 start_codon:yes stop_codon:yes gene_type:complete